MTPSFSNVPPPPQAGTHILASLQKSTPSPHSFVLDLQSPMYEQGAAIHCDADGFSIMICCAVACCRLQM